MNKYCKTWVRTWHFTRDYIAICPYCLSFEEAKKEKDDFYSGRAYWEHEHPLTFIVLEEVYREQGESERRMEVVGETVNIGEVLDTARFYWLEEGFSVEEVQAVLEAFLSYIHHATVDTPLDRGEER